MQGTSQQAFRWLTSSRLTKITISIHTTEMKEFLMMNINAIIIWVRNPAALSCHKNIITP